MPTKTFPITNITRGNDITLNFQVKTTADLASARFMVKRRTRDSDLPANVILDKTVTITLTTNGQITDVGGADDLATVLIFLTKADTALLEAGKSYVWDLEVFDGAGKSATPVGGTIEMDPRVRTATG